MSNNDTMKFSFGDESHQAHKAELLWSREKPRNAARIASMTQHTVAALQAQTSTNTQEPTDAISDTADVEPRTTAEEIAHYAVASGWQTENSGVTTPTSEVPYERTRVEVGPEKRYIDASRVWGITGQPYIHWATPSRKTAALAITAVRELGSGVIVELVPFKAPFSMPKYLVPEKKSSKELILQDVDQEHTITVQDVDGCEGVWKKSLLQITTKDAAGKSVEWRVRHLLIRCPKVEKKPEKIAKLWRSIAYLVHATNQSISVIDHDHDEVPGHHQYRYRGKDGSKLPIVFGGFVGVARWITAVLETLRYGCWLPKNPEGSSGNQGILYPLPSEFEDDPYIQQLDAVAEQRGWTGQMNDWEKEAALLDTMWGYQLMTKMARLPKERDVDEYFIDWPESLFSIVIQPVTATR